MSRATYLNKSILEADGKGFTLSRGKRTGEVRIGIGPQGGDPLVTMLLYPSMVRQAIESLKELSRDKGAGGE